MVGVTSRRTVSHENSGRANDGGCCGMPPNLLPMVSTGISSQRDSSVSVTSATTGAGMRAKRRTVWPSVKRSTGEPCINKRGQTKTPTKHAAPKPSAYGLTLPMCSASVCTCEKKLPGIFSTASPSQSFSCDSAISTAMPLVKPITMLTGTKRTKLPSLNSPSANNNTPAQAVEISKLATP